MAIDIIVYTIVYLLVLLQLAAGVGGTAAEPAEGRVLTLDEQWHSVG